jgi:hypothetical protein
MGRSVPKLGKVGAPDHPTQQSLEAVRLAEKEKALVDPQPQSDSAPRLVAREPSDLMLLDSIGGLDEENDDYSDLSTKVLHEESHIATIKALFAQAEQAERQEALAAAAAEAQAGPARAPDAAEAADPFGGLIPVEDEAPVEPDEPDEPELGDEDLVWDDPGFEEGLPIVAAIAAPRSSPDELVAISAIVPRVLLSPGEIAKLPIDPRAAFILSHVDGIHSMEEILDMCAMAETEAASLLEKLRAMGVITLG